MDLEAQVEFEQLFNKNHLKKRLKSEFTDPAIHQYISSHGIPLDFGIDLLVQMVIHKRCTVGALIGILEHHFNSMQECADELLKAAEAGLVDFNGEKFILKWEFDVTKDVYEDLDRYQYPLPCVISPKEVKTNHDTGYYTSTGSIVLQEHNPEGDLCLDHINRVNSIPLTINENTAKFVKNKWKNIEKPKEGEYFKDYQKRVKAFEKYNQNSKEVHEHLIECGNEFYVTNKYDKRGRVYSCGYHVNPQGTDYNKAIIEFANKELVK